MAVENLSRMGFKALFFASVLGLTACGGGGGTTGGGATPVETQQEQEALFFEYVSPNYSVGDEPVQLVVTGGSGTGAITFTSSDPESVEVDPQTGVVNFVGPSWGVEITAEKAGDDQYNSRAASNVSTFNVKDASAVIRFDVYGTRTEMTWPHQNDEITVFRSGDIGYCSIEMIESCYEGKKTTVLDASYLPLKDSYITWYQSAWLTFHTPYYQSQGYYAGVKAADFSNRFGHQMIEFDSKLWVIGGLVYNGDDTNWFNDVWSSEDGVSWEQVTESADFSPRGHFQAAAFNDALYIIGGSIGIGTGGAESFTNEVWKTQDGEIWELVSTTGMPSTVTGHQVAEFQGKLWLIGGYGYDREKIYSSADGENWIVESDTVPFGIREDFELVAFNNKLFLIGGWVDSSLNLYNDVWSTEDGVNWIQETSRAAFTARANPEAVVHNGKLLLVGGHNFSENFKHIYESDDGINWARKIDNFIPNLDQEIQVSSFDGSLWVYSGSSKGTLWNSETADVWKNSFEFKPYWEPHYLKGSYDLLYIDSSAVKQRLKLDYDSNFVIRSWNDTASTVISDGVERTKGGDRSFVSGRWKPVLSDAFVEFSVEENLYCSPDDIWEVHSSDEEVFTVNFEMTDSGYDAGGDGFGILDTNEPFVRNTSVGLENTVNAGDNCIY